MEEIFQPRSIDAFEYFYPEALEQMRTWIQNVLSKKEKRILWLCGSVGCGKSVMAQLFLESYPFHIRTIHAGSMRSGKQLQLWLDNSQTYKNIMECLKGGRNTMAILVEDMESFLSPTDRSGYSHFFQQIEKRMDKEEKGKSLLYPIVCVAKKGPGFEKKWTKWKSLCQEIHLPPLNPPTLQTWLVEHLPYPLQNTWLEQLSTQCQGNLFQLKQWCMEIDYLQLCFGSDFLEKDWSSVQKRILYGGTIENDDEQGVLEDWDGSYNEFFQKMYELPNEEKTLSQCVQWFESDSFFVPYGMFENGIRWLIGGNSPDQWNSIYSMYQCFLQYFIYQKNQFENSGVMDITFQYAYYTLYQPWKIIDTNKKKWKVPQFSWIYNKTSYTLAYMKRRNEFQWNTKGSFQKTWESHCKTWISLHKRRDYSDREKECLIQWTKTEEKECQWYNVFHLPIENDWKEFLHPWCEPNLLPWENLAPKRKYEKKKKIPVVDL